MKKFGIGIILAIVGILGAVTLIRTVLNYGGQTKPAEKQSLIEFREQRHIWTPDAQQPIPLHSSDEHPLIHYIHALFYPVNRLLSPINATLVFEGFFNGSRVEFMLGETAGLSAPDQRHALGQYYIVPYGEYASDSQREMYSSLTLYDQELLIEKGCPILHYIYKDQPLASQDDPFQAFPPRENLCAFALGPGITLNFWLNVRSGQVCNVEPPGSQTSVFPPCRLDQLMDFKELDEVSPVVEKPTVWTGSTP